MRELKCTQQNPMYGLLHIRLRILGKLVFVRFSENCPQKNQMIQSLKSKGAGIEEVGNWIQIDMFKTNTFVKIGEHEFDATKTSDDKVEKILAEFYTEKYTQAKFKVEELK